jgi:hypothetical protein
MVGAARPGLGEVGDVGHAVFDTYVRRDPVLLARREAGRMHRAVDEFHHAGRPS